MRRWAVLTASLMMAMLLVPALPAQAAPPVAVTITVDEPLPVATGAVSATSDVCAGGTTTSDTVKVVVTKNFTRLWVIKTFDCGGDGTFDVFLKAKLFPDGTSGRWTVLGGTGDFAALKGSGSLVGTPYDDGGGNTGIIDVYTGKMKNLP